VDQGQRKVASSVRRQRDGCAALGSPLYAELLDRAAADVDAGGPVWRVLEPFAGWPPESAFVLRFMGAVHRLVLEGSAPALAPFFGRRGNGAAAWPAFRALVEEREDELRESALRRPVQTNEVGRCAALAPAILRASNGLPLRLLEVGASGGLNLRFDAYRYGDLWGPSDSPVKLLGRYEGDPPPFPSRPVRIAERAGCDRAPVDATTDEGRLTLLSYVWPDQSERMAVLEGALEVARRVPVSVDRAAAGEWLDHVLAEPRPGVATVVFHSIVWQYLDDAERARVRATIERAGERATRDAPVAWVGMEHDGDDAGGPRVYSTTWPGGEPVLVARAGFHGRHVRWLA
jgi:hypothetical protein